MVHYDIRSLEDAADVKIVQDEAMYAGDIDDDGKPCWSAENHLKCGSQAILNHCHFALLGQAYQVHHSKPLSHSPL